MKKLFLPFLIILLLTSCRHRLVPMIGMDSNGDEVIEHVSAVNFKSSSADVMNLVAKDTLTTLSNHKFNSGWDMNHFQVGLLINTTVGPLAWKVSATPGFRLVFKKVKK